MGRRKPQGPPPSKKEIATDMKNSFEDDGRTLEQLRQAKEKEQRKYDWFRVRQEEREKIVDEVLEMLDKLPEEAEELAKNNPDSEKDYRGAIRNMGMELKGKYKRGVPPMKYHDKLNTLKYKIMGGRLVNGEDPDEVM